MTKIMKKLKESIHFVKIPFLLSVLFFSIGFLYGFAMTYCDPSSTEFLNPLDEINREKLSHINIYTILTNNLKVILLLILGTFLLSIPSIATLLLNGAVFGKFEAFSLVTNFTINPHFLIWPHGIFECIAILFAGAVGISLPYQIIKYLRYGEDILNRSDCEDLLLLVLLSVMLTIVAALVEVYVTKSIALRGGMY